MNSDLRRQLKALVDDLTGPLGPMPFDRAVRRHLALFEGFRAAGYTWSQIARALAAAGIQRPDGEGYAAERLRAAVFRQEKRKGAVLPEQAASKSKPGETITPGRTQKEPVEPSRTEKPVQRPVVLSSIHAKLSRVAKLRGG
jgi:hypothetical protein